MLLLTVIQWLICACFFDFFFNEIDSGIVCKSAHAYCGRNVSGICFIRLILVYFGVLCCNHPGSTGTNCNAMNWVEVFKFLRLRCIVLFR